MARQHGGAASGTLVTTLVVSSPAVCHICAVLRAISATTMVLTMLTGCDSASAPSSAIPTATTDAATTTGAGVRIDDAPAKQKTPLAVDKLPTGIYAVSDYWQGDSCKSVDARASSAGAIQHFYISDTPWGSGVMANLASCGTLEVCRENLLATLKGKGGPIPERRLSVTHQDERGRLLGQHYFTGFGKPEHCEAAVVREGWLESRDDNQWRLVLHERKGDVPKDNGMCSTNNARAKLASAPCTLQVFDIKHIEAAPKVACADQPSCGQLGFCTEQDARCVAGKDDDCKPTSLCKLSGRCSAIDGSCQASDEGCAASDNCKKAGYCHALPISADDKELVCRATSDKDCLAASNCKTKGDCGLTKEGLCRPRNDADCKNAALCKDKGLCKKGDSNNPWHACIKG